MRVLNISQVDTIFANGSYPIEFLFFYKHKLQTDKIRSALRKLSSSFWPVFGEYGDGIIYFDKYEEKNYFIEEVIDEEFEIDGEEINISQGNRRFIPTDSKKLFFLKVLQYKNGTILFPKLNHMAGDGYSYFYFLSALAMLCKNSNQALEKMFSPCHERTMLKDFQYRIKVPYLKTENRNLTLKVEKIPKSSIRTIIKETSSNFGKAVSTNDILSAMIVKKLTEIRADQFGNEFHLTIPIDVRSQIKEYGRYFFGNALMFHVTEFITKEIFECSIEELAVEIRTGMPEINKENYLKYLKSFEEIIMNKQTEKLKPYNPETGCLVTNLSAMPSDKLDFGTGNPDFIYPLTTGKNAAAILSDKDNFILRLVY